MLASFSVCMSVTLKWADGQGQGTHPLEHSLSVRRVERSGWSGERNAACKNNYVDTEHHGGWKIYCAVELNGCRGLLRGNYLPHKLFFISSPFPTNTSLKAEINFYIYMLLRCKQQDIFMNGTHVFNTN